MVQDGWIYFLLFNMDGKVLNDKVLESFHILGLNHLLML
jgi:hypothetical protein